MPWTLLRITTDLTADGDWRGLDRSSSSAPASDRAGDSGSTIFVQVGNATGHAVTFGADRDEILIRVAWCTAGGSFVAGTGTSLDVEPVTIDSLPHPTQPTQRIEQLSVGEVREASAWVPLYLRVGPGALATVRLSNMVFASATRVAVYVWTR